jgi:hypothetical protein
MNFVEKCIQNKGRLYQLTFPSLSQDDNYTNPSVYTINDKILINFRHMDKTKHLTAWKKYDDKVYAPNCHIHPILDPTILSFNFIGEYDKNINLSTKTIVDTSKFDNYEKLSWYAGLEDATLVFWDNKFYLSGVRKDVDIIGKGRMELSQIQFEGNTIKEVARHRIEIAQYEHVYCEKNWMPILSMPYHFIRWINPTEIVYYDIKSNKSEIILSRKYKQIDSHSFHGGSQVIPYNEGYICLCHQTYYKFDDKIFPDGVYKHRFIVWDKNWNIIKCSPQFSFLGNDVEFCVGMAEYLDDYLITFGVNECFSFLLKVPKKYISEFLVDV